MADKTILILGGGIGGIVTARELRRHLGNQHRIVIVDREAVYSFPPSFLWVMVGWRKLEAVQKPLSLLEKYGIELCHATVENIRLEEQRVETNRGVLQYDYLVIALGAELAPETIPGLVETAHSFYTLDQALRLYQQVRLFQGGTIAIVIATLPYKCPPAPYEAAMLLESYFSRKGIRNVTIDVFTPETSPLHIAGDGATSMVTDMLKQRGIGLHPGHNLSRVRPTERALVFDNETLHTYDLLIAIPPHRASSLLQATGLTNDTGWIAVDELTLSTRQPHIFALGDVTTIPLPNGNTLPKAGVFAHNEAEVIAYNIAQDIWNGHQRKEFAGTGFCFIETGNGRAGYVHGNFFTRPAPSVTVSEPSVTYHWGKVVFEKYWLWRWF